MTTCICGHHDTEHEISTDGTFIDWCDVRGCPCQRFTDQSQIAFDFDDEDEPDLDDIEEFENSLLDGDGEDDDE